MKSEACHTANKVLRKLKNFLFYSVLNMYLGRICGERVTRALFIKRAHH